MGNGQKYRAFLSYSHANTKVAKRVHAWLEGFRIDKDLVGQSTPAGTIPESLRPIFRDRYEFDAGGSLAEQTNLALDASAALIVLASSHAARSKYVNAELSIFKSRHPERPVIPLIIDGEPGDIANECFPPALRFAVNRDGSISETPVDLLAADLREQGDGFELALAKVVARLLGVPPDDIYRRADRERRRQLHRSRRIQALIYTLMACIILGLVGWINQAYIKKQINWYLVMRPYMISEIRPYVLSAPTEHALKPLKSFRECGKDCPTMIVIPAGNFIMGSPSSEQGHVDHEAPQHSVSIPRPFAISKFDVTFAEWDSCVSVGGCPHVSEPTFAKPNMPAVNITWEEAEQYAAWFAEMTGKPYRLPTEAEWEYAARAGSTTAYYWGDEIGKGNANCKSCGSEWDDRQTSPVGSFKPNAFGLYDMAGNVWQWVQDCFHRSYEGAPNNGSAWDTGTCYSRVDRGGSWTVEPTFLRSAFRAWDTPVARDDDLGFRLARSLNAPAAHQLSAP
jgi:formylglycine-generating enzyme required for sulfatase activity